MASLLMPCLVGTRESFIATDMINSTSAPPFSCESEEELDFPIIPGLPDDLAMSCLTYVPRTAFPTMAAVSMKWRSAILSKEFLKLRKDGHQLEELLYMLVCNPDGMNSHWELLTRFHKEPKVLPPMPGPEKAGFGVVTLEAKLFVVAGYTSDARKTVSDDVYQYDSRVNRWSSLAKINIPRRDFACAEINGIIYAAGGFGSDGDCLSSVEAYDPKINKWTLIESLRRPRWGAFACNLEGKLYVMGGRSSFTIGNSKSVDVYSPEDHSWCEMKNGRVMITASAVLNKKLFCIEWKNDTSLSIYTPANNTWVSEPMPVAGSSAVRYRFGTFDGKLLLFPVEKRPRHNTLLYDPDVVAGSKWRTSSFKPSGMCLCTVTMTA